MPTRHVLNNYTKQSILRHPHSLLSSVFDTSKHNLTVVRLSTSMSFTSVFLSSNRRRTARPVTWHSGVSLLHTRKTWVSQDTSRFACQTMSSIFYLSSKKCVVSLSSTALDSERLFLMFHLDSILRLQSNVNFPREVVCPAMSECVGTVCIWPW